MKFRSIAFMLAAACLLCGCGQVEEPENPYRLKQQTVQWYQESETQIVRTDYAYDAQNQVTEASTYFDGDWHSTMYYTRDDYGNVVHSRHTFADGTENSQEEVLTLDDQHRVIRSEGIWDNGQRTLAEYSYNSAGQTTKQYFYRFGLLDGLDINSFTDNTYDRKGNLVRVDVRWEPDNGNNSRTLCSYKNGRIVKEETYRMEVLETYVEYTYDETGLVQTANAYKADGTPESRHVTTFDEYGNKLEVVAYAYASELALYGETDEKPDSLTTNVYELKE